MLKAVLESVRLSPQACASLLGVPQSIFADWMAGSRPMPASYARNLGSILGLPPERLLEANRAAKSDADVVPAIWFKLRDPRLNDTDREYVALIRHLAYRVDQFETVTAEPPLVWDSTFAGVRAATDREAPPREQGRQAARALRVERGLQQGAVGIGSALRGALRSMGILVLETPIHPSALEGCSFYVASSSKKKARPCVFANSHSTTWFRRNAILAHEVDHLIFDARSSGASLDFKPEEGHPGVSAIAAEAAEELTSEQRAEAFSQELLVPREVIRHLSKGMNWSTLTADDMARIVADAHVEQRLIVRAALDAELVDEAGAEHARNLDIGSILPEKTDRALNAVQYFKREPQAASWLTKRITTAFPLPLRLPMAYVKGVVDAVATGMIAWSKGAELLMIDRQTFEQRFGDLIPAE